MARVIRALLGPSKDGVMPMKLEGETAWTRWYLDHEAPAAAVCAALAEVQLRVARDEIEVGNGFDLKIELVRDGVVAAPLNGFCYDCMPLAHDIEHSQKEAYERASDLRAALKRLADAAEAEASTEPDMPSYESTMDDFENALDEARALIKEADDGC